MASTAAGRRRRSRASAVARRGQARDQAQRARRDDGERALAAGEQGRRGRSRRRRPGARRSGDHGAVGEDRLDAGDLGARRPWQDRVLSTGVRGDRAADRGAVAGGEVDAVGPPVARACAWTAARVAPAPAITVAGGVVTSRSPSAVRSRGRSDRRRAARLRRPGRCCRPGARRPRALRRRPPGPPRPAPLSAGRTTARARRRNRPVQSRSYPAVRAGSVSTCSAPTTSASASSNGSERIRVRLRPGLDVLGLRDQRAVVEFEHRHPPLPGLVLDLPAADVEPA